METELIISIQDKKGLDTDFLKCKVEVGSKIGYLDQSNPARFILDSYTPTTPISFSLYSNEEPLAAAKVTFNALVGDQRRSEKWIKFKESTGKDIRLKVYVVLLEAQTSSDLSIAKRHQDKENPPVCPAVGSLFKEKTSELEELWKNRSCLGDFLTEKTVKISFEPLGSIKEPPIKISTIENLNPEVLQKSCGECIKSIKDLSYDVNHLKATSQELPALRDNFSGKVNERLLQQSLCRQFSDDVQDKKIKDLQEIQTLLDQERKLAQDIQEEEEYQRKSLIEIDEMRLEYDFILRENIIIKAERLKNTDLDQVIKRLKEDLENCTQKFHSSEKKYSEIAKTMEDAKHLMENNLKKISEELEATKLSLESSNKLNEDLNLKNQSLKQACEVLKSNEKDLESIKSSLSEAKSSSSLFQSKKHQLLSELSASWDSLLTENDQIKSKTSSILDLQKSLLESLPSDYNSLEASTESLLETESKLLNLSNSKITLEQQCCIRLDLKQLIDDYSVMQNVYKTSRAEVLKALNQGCDYLLKDSEKVLDECKKIDVLMDNIDEKDYEIQNMRTLLGEIKGRQPVYVPVESDSIDIALSEYLNSCEHPVSIPFNRQDEGVYVFGTKKVFLKLENGKIKIRVGGGYTHIDEFIEVYAPIELERQEEAIGADCPQLSSTLSRFRTGPKGMSPLRAARIIQTAVEAISQGSPAKALVRTKSKK